MNKQKKTTGSKNNKIKSNNKNSNRLIELCLPDILKGLHINFLDIKENGKDHNSIMISMKDEIIAYYGLIEAEKTFWPILHRLAKIVNQRSYEERT